MEEKKEIKFKDLSMPLKIAVVASWIVGILYILFFVAGFMSGAAA